MKVVVIIFVYIIAAAVRHKLVTKVTHSNSEVQNTVKLWVQYAAEHGGG